MTDWRKNTPAHKYKLQVTEYAEQDLEEIGDYITILCGFPPGSIVQVLLPARMEDGRKLWFR